MSEVQSGESASLRVALSTIGTFHTFDMARQLEVAGVLQRVFTGYPRFKLPAAGIHRAKIRTFPWLHGPYMAGWIPARLKREWEYADKLAFDAYVAATLPACDVLCAMSGSGLRSGRRAKTLGARYVCDRGSAHIRRQDELLREEFGHWGLPYAGIDARVIDREEREYALADAIFVPSRFALRSFVEQGVDARKLRLVPYGVDLSRFEPVAQPRPEGFDLLFVGALSVRKGAHYLLSAFEQLRARRKSLTLAGLVTPEMAPALNRFVARNDDVRVLGHVPQEKLKDLMSRSHALVLPSIEEGLALVQAQAMACACPVVASRNTGAEDLFSDGLEGFIVPPRSEAALRDALQRLADDPGLRSRLSEAALERVRKIGGWREYGRKVLDAFRDLAAPASAAALARGAGS